MSERIVCGAKTRTGAPCQTPPMAGATRCRMHGGASPRSLAKAKERLAEAAAIRTAAKAFGSDLPPHVDPIDALMELIARKAREVAFYRAQVATLGEDALVFGLTEHREGLGPEGPVDVRTQKATPHTWLTLLHQAEDQLAKYSAAAVNAGVAERTVAIAETQAAQFVGVIQRALASVTIDAVILDQIHTAFATELRAIDEVTA